MIMRRTKLLLLFLSGALASGCANQGPEMKTVNYVDIERFMGDWYVIANIPTFVEKGAHNAVETYALNDDGTIATTFRFRKDGFDGKQKEYNPKGFIRDYTSNALWGMQFIWPFKGDYRIVYVADDYSTTVIGRQKRDYVWIMAREPAIDEESYNDLIDFVESIGYDRSAIKRIPQSWPDDSGAK